MWPLAHRPNPIALGCMCKCPLPTKTWSILLTHEGPCHPPSQSRACLAYRAGWETAPTSEGSRRCPGPTRACTQGLGLEWRLPHPTPRPQAWSCRARSSRPPDSGLCRKGRKRWTSIVDGGVHWAQLTTVGPHGWSCGNAPMAGPTRTRSSASERQIHPPGSTLRGSCGPDSPTHRAGDRSSMGPGDSGTACSGNSRVHLSA